MLTLSRHVLIIFSLGLFPLISSGAVLVQQNASYLAFEAEDYDSLTPSTGGWTVVTTTTGPKLLPSDTAAVGGAALYSQAGDSSYATYRLQFTSNGTYYLYSRFSFFNRNGDTSYGNEDSFNLPDVFGQGATAANGEVWHEQHTGGTFPNEGKTFFWDEANKMKTDGANRVPDGVHTYTITGASEATPVEVTFTIRGREAGMTLDRFIFTTTQYNPSTQNAILNDFASVPEPSRALLIAMALTMTIMRRKRLA